uniref:Uncharacterized protein n=1 Tax=Lepeophtheirus salmonis TaxID=72036 RepID=A0A0K2V6B9_LEPSM
MRRIDGFVLMDLNPNYNSKSTNEKDLSRSRFLKLTSWVVQLILERTTLSQGILLI